MLQMNLLNGVQSTTSLLSTLLKNHGCWDEILNTEISEIKKSPDVVVGTFIFTVNFLISIFLYGSFSCSRVGT